MWHFSALIIISLLTDKGSRPCSQKDVKQIFLWKYHGRENKFNDQNNGALNVLESCKLIVRKRATQGNRKNNEIHLTSAGTSLVNELRESRKADVLTILAHLGVRDENKYPYEKIGIALANLANELWNVVLEDSKKSVKKLSRNKA